MRSGIIAAVAAAALACGAGVATAQTSGTPSDRSGATSGASNPSGVEEEIRRQLQQIGYTEVGPVTRSATEEGIYETTAKREGQDLTLRIDVLRGEIHESKG